MNRRFHLFKVKLPSVSFLQRDVRWTFWLQSHQKHSGLNMLEYVINFFIGYIIVVIILGKKRFSFEKQMLAVFLSVAANVGAILGLWIVSTWFTS